MPAAGSAGAVDHMPRRTALSRVTIFAKGNLDVRDSLHVLRVGGAVRWNGINEVLRARGSSAVARVRHETWTRSDALLASAGSLPADLAARDLPLGVHGMAAQFSHAVFGADADAYVLSIQPDITVPLVRHGREGYLLHPADWPSWPVADRHWLQTEFSPVPALDADTSMRNLERIVARIRAHSEAPILVYNVSAVVPGETVHVHAGLGEILSTRIRRFNLGLADLSQRTGISIVDVDAIVARAGADRLKLDAFHLNGEGCRLVAQEVVRVLDECDCFTAAGALR